MNFAQTILAWYKQNKRDLPWRRTSNPYFIWLSEVILQQTRVEQGLSYYLRFVKAFPTVKKLAAAKEEQVLKLWQGLGYYSRARNLHHAAKEIVKKHKGKFPETYADIRALKGVGDYTAAAIASFAFNQPYAAVDGNVYRLLSRYLGIRTPVNTGKAKKEFAAAAQELMEHSPPHDFNQAIMEFGSRVCKPANPGCVNCPLNSSCMAFQKKWVSKLPVKNEKQKVKRRYLHYLHISDGNHTWMRKRTGQDIWKNLYEFPMVEMTRPGSTAALIAEARRLKMVQGAIAAEGEPQRVRHLLSHQAIFATFHRLRAVRPVHIAGARKVSNRRISSLPVHKLIEKYLETLPKGSLKNGIFTVGRFAGIHSNSKTQ